jgi:hypothetical protein
MSLATRSASHEDSEGCAHLLECLCAAGDIPGTLDRCRIQVPALAPDTDAKTACTRYSEFLIPGFIHHTAPPPLACLETFRQVEFRVPKAGARRCCGR